MPFIKTLFLFSLLAVTALAAPGGPVAIVVNQEVPFEDLTLPEVRKVFLGERQYWNPKLRVVLLMRFCSRRERQTHGYGGAHIVPRATAWACWELAAREFGQSPCKNHRRGWS